MAKEEKKKKEKKEKKKDGGGEKSSWSLLSWIVMGVVVITCAGLGFGTSYIIASPKDAVATGEDTSEESVQTEEDLPADAEVADPSSSTWHFNMNPLIATLNEPRATRYIKIGLTLELDFDPGNDPGKELLEKNMPVLTNWMMIYLSSLSLEDTQGGSNKKRMQMEMLDSFNEILWPQAKPGIKRILFKEFAIQ